MNRLIIFLTVIAFFFTAVGGSASAFIIDLPDIDEKGYILDVTNGALWEDIDNHYNETYVDVESQLPEGFRMATKSDLEQLHLETGPTPPWLRLIMGMGHSSTIINGAYNNEEEDNMTSKSWKWEWQVGWTISQFKTWNIYEDHDHTTGYWIVNPNGMEWYRNALINSLR